MNSFLCPIDQEVPEVARGSTFVCYCIKIVNLAMIGHRQLGQTTLTTSPNRSSNVRINIQLRLALKLCVLRLYRGQKKDCTGLRVPRCLITLRIHALICLYMMALPRRSIWARDDGRPNRAFHPSFERFLLRLEDPDSTGPHNVLCETAALRRGLSMVELGRAVDEAWAYIRIVGNKFLVSRDANLAENHCSPGRCFSKFASDIGCRFYSCRTLYSERLRQNMQSSLK